MMEANDPEPIPITPVEQSQRATSVATPASTSVEQSDPSNQNNQNQTPTIVEDDETPPSPSGNPPTGQTEGASTQQSRSDQSPAGPRRSQRLAKKLRRSARIAKSEQSPHPSLIRAHFVRLGISTEREDGTIDDIHPLIHAFASSVSTGDPDTMHLGDARKQHDWSDFQKAMDKELDDFSQRKHWQLVPATVTDELKSTGIKFDVIQAVWSFKRKRTPSGALLKHKSRLCAHGGQQTSNTFWESFSPVVQWTTLRTILTLSLIRKWKARSIDFVLAYPQADMKSNVFLKIPFGFKIADPSKWLLLENEVYHLPTYTYVIDRMSIEWSWSSLSKVWMNAYLLDRINL